MPWGNWVLQAFAHSQSPPPPPPPPLVSAEPHCEGCSALIGGEAATLDEGMADIVGPSVLPLIVQLVCFCGKRIQPCKTLRTEAGVGCSAAPSASDIAAVLEL